MSSSSSNRPSATIPGKHLSVIPYARPTDDMQLSTTFRVADPRYQGTAGGDHDDDIAYVPRHIPVIDLCYDTPEKPTNARRRVPPSNTTDADANDISIVDLCSLDDTITDVDAQPTPRSNASAPTAPSRAPAKPMSSIQRNPTVIQAGVLPGTCAICLNKFGDHTSATRCGHVFCTRCITTAVMINHKCPLCNNSQSRQHLLRLFVSNK